MKLPLQNLPLTWDMTAQDMMTPNPQSIREDATVTEAVAFLIDKGYRAAPVIDASGKPVGVISQSDIVVHDREEVSKSGRTHEYFERDALDVPQTRAYRTGSEFRVRDLMTPTIFQVPPDAPFSRVLGEMIALNVHRLFVVAEDGVLIGVVTALDMLRHQYHEIRRESAEWLATAP